MNNSEIQVGIKALKKGEVIAYPSEGVWGLGCDPFNREAVERILSLKSRSVEKGLILVSSSLDQINPLLENLTPELRKKLEKSCPGPDTWLIPDPGQLIPAWIKGKFDTVAVRVSEHLTVQHLCIGFGGLIVSTSANPEGLPPAKNEQEVREYFPKGERSGLDIIVPGRLGAQDGPSSIKDLMSQQILRM